MLLCFRCSSETKKQLESLVAHGGYADHSEVISAAIANLAVLENEFAGKQEVVISRAVAVPASRSPKGQPSASQNSDREVVATAGEKSFPAGSQRDNGRQKVPELFVLDGLPKAAPSGLAELPPDRWQQGQPVPLERWILGQFNRLLPAKVNARALIRLFAAEGALSISEAAQRVAEQALELSDFLTHLDRVKKIPRDEALATAFPQRRKDSAKGCLRYANQFVVYQNSRGELSGLMIDLKLINVEIHKRERRILPTQAAWDFARLENPILDGKLKGKMGKFSDDEQSFLLEHILRGVPVESFAYNAILEAVGKGENTPEKIDQWLQQYVSKERAADLSQSFLTSQRSGAISRMSDLGLIERQRDGVRVSYEITTQGETFLERYRAQLKTVSAGRRVKSVI